MTLFEDPTWCSKNHVPGKVFRSLIGKEKHKLREVPAFSYEVYQPHTIVKPPPKFDPLEPKPVKTSIFRKFFLRGDIPARKRLPGIKYKQQTVFEIGTQKVMSRLIWNVPPILLDYSLYLPMFFDGLVEIEEPYKSLAFIGTYELILFGKDKILPIIPLLIYPIKRAFATKIPEVIIKTLNLIQHMVREGTCVGPALVPYFRQILTPLNIFKQVNVNLGDEIERHREDRLGDVIEDTLQLLELCGGPDAYLNIKYNIPTYESYVNN